MEEALVSVDLPVTESVPVAVRFAAERLPEKSPLLCTAKPVAGEVVPTPALPPAVTINCPPPTSSRPWGEKVRMPNLAFVVSKDKRGLVEVEEVAKVKAFTLELESVGLEEAIVVVAKLLKEKVPAMRVTLSPMASPKVALFSMVRVLMEVVASEEPPERVTELAKTSPSASTRNLTAPLTAMPRRLVSAAAEEGFMTTEALVTAELDAPMDHEEKVWVVTGEKVVTSEPPTESEPENMPLPVTEKVFEGEVVPMPIL